MLEVFYAAAAFSRFNSDIENASKVASVSTQADHLRMQVRRLETTVERQALACQAMWELLQQHLPVGEKDLLKKMEQVDLRDGVADGRMTPQAKTCTACSRTVHAKRKNCLYCGADVGGPPSAF
ncbi:MAG TPA: hypothetical protein VGN57_04630 [Pirellulaceae bacterium]|jgi:hypothetical protein|nr:hypothetical protein [Pirellulaceae bacterium]